MLKTISRILIVVIPLTLMVGGCRRATESIRVGYVPIADNLQLFVGIEQGYYEQEGLKIEPLPISSGPKVLEALWSRSSEGIDIGFSSVVPIILAKAQDLPIVAMAGGPVETAAHKTHAILVRADSQIRTGADLKGKTVAINAFRNIEHVMLHRYLERFGIPPQDIQVVEIPFPEMESSLLSQRVDAVAAIEPYLTLALQRGGVRLIDYHYTVIQPRTVVSSYITTPDWFRANPDAARRFVRATERATDYIRTHEAEARKILLKYTKINESTAQVMVLPEFESEHPDKDIQEWVDLMLRQGLIKKPVDVKDLFPKL